MLDIIKSEVGCESCGEKELELHFHHRDPTQKIGKVGRIAIEKLIAEIEKCDILCVPCHNETRRSRGSMVQTKNGYHVAYHTTSKIKAERIRDLIWDNT